MTTRIVIPAWCMDLYRFTRFSAFGATAVLPLLGAGSVNPELSLRDSLRLLGVAACFHSFAYIHNDVCDLELDRSQPLRTDYPLVRGDLAPGTALVLALSAIPAAFSLSQGRGGRGYLAAACVLMAVYNRWGKACPFPPLTDLVQALGWASLIAYGAEAGGARPNRLTHSLIGYEILLILMVNGVHGALRDLSNDAACGAQTTAIMLGASASPAGLRIGSGLLSYAGVLQAALLALPYWAIATQPPATQRRAAAGITALSALSLGLLMRAARGTMVATDAGMLHLILLLSTPIALVAPGLGWPLRATTLIAHSLPLLANGMTYAALQNI
ncbi:UbiA family prenyltransferase [Candidatus Oscillochloris fontis]|uniref:UbiA family prenyltransferase n=1 Tax=Candidatus Oscillochloris fontis TaxID=2496868 RepID=UPI00101D2F50|nr:UbiA family prenyltransferase [Candidatus Oscillochloris fontis]